MLQSVIPTRPPQRAREGPPCCRCQKRICNQQTSSSKKLKGIYLRGNIYWFTHGTGACSTQVSLETDDEAEAIKKALLVLDNPELNPCNVLTELN